MFFSHLLKFSIVVLSICHCFYVEIKLTDVNELHTVTLICGPPTENKNLDRNHTVIWHGSQFGVEEQQKLAETVKADALVPNIAINSSRRHRCYLLAGEDGNKTFHLPQKRRVSREGSQASIPSDNGMCPPGHRIDQDRCFPCFPGSYTSGQESVCYLCPKDFYMDKTAADACWPCPEGKKTLAEGADTDESCVYFDETGHPLPPQSLPWIAIFALVCVIIACIWIIIIVMLTFYWRHKHKDDAEQPEVESERGTRSSKPLLSGSDSNIYESISDFSDSDDHKYAEIGDFDDYEVPRKKSDDYEVPIKPGDDYEVPRTPGDDYDVPRKPIFMPDNRARPWKPSRPRQKGSAEDHLYETLSSDEHVYEAPIPKRTVSQPSRSGDLPPMRRGESEDIYDDIMYVTIDSEAGNPFARTRSKGFKPGSTTMMSVQDESLEGLERAESRKSSSGILRNEKSRQEM